MRKMISLAAVVVLSSCQGQMRALESGGALRAEPSTRPGSDYVVHVKNTIDFGYDPDDKAIREKYALELMKTECPNARVVDEGVITTGTYLTGRPSKTYSLYIKCSP